MTFGRKTSGADFVLIDASLRPAIDSKSAPPAAQIHLQEIKK